MGIRTTVSFRENESTERSVIALSPFAPDSSGTDLRSRYRGLAFLFDDLDQATDFARSVLSWASRHLHGELMTVESCVVPYGRERRTT